MSIKIKSLRLSQREYEVEGFGIPLAFRLSEDSRISPIYKIDYDELTSTGLKAQGSVKISKEDSVEELLSIIKRLEEIVLKECE